jgi:hypothetical protein
VVNILVTLCNDGIVNQEVSLHSENIGIRLRRPAILFP